MQSFLRGWQRKTGILVLCFALLVMNAWVRSFSEKHRYSFPLENGSVFLIRPIRHVISFEIMTEYSGPCAYYVQYWEVRYSSIVWPSILVSAWLLLSKPRAKPPAPTPTE